MAGIKDKMSKLKNWMIVEDEKSDEEYDAYDDYEDGYDDYDEKYDDYEDDQEGDFPYSSGIASNRVHEYQTHNQMKVVIVDPLTYEDAATIADHLRLRKTVIVNLQKMSDYKIKKSIFDFMNGAVYVLDGSIQGVSKSIFILAPKNVDVDVNVKKELESKPVLPWQNK